MLVFTRQAQTEFTIGTIRIRILRIVGGNVRVGIEAPKGVPILRDDAKARDCRDKDDRKERG